MRFFYLTYIIGGNEGAGRDMKSETATCHSYPCS